MWNSAAFSSDCNLSSLMEGGGGSDSSSLHSPNEYDDKLFLTEWFTSPYCTDGAVIPSEMEISSSSLPLSPLVGEGKGLMKRVGLNSEETQMMITSQAVSEIERGIALREDSSLRGAKRLKSTCIEKEANKPPLMEASEKQPAKAQVRRSQKLGHKIAALQQLVCPFGKTDTASVLNETALCIKFLHDQINILTAPYMTVPCYQQAIIDRRNELHKKGLCVVPISPAIINLTSQLPFDKNLPANAAPKYRFQM